MSEAFRQPQFVGQADARTIKPHEQMQGKEQRMSAEQQQFLNTYQKEFSRAQMAEREANTHARDRLKELSAPELRKIGAKQLLWGWGLSFINGIGAGLGFLGGAAGVGAIGSALGVSAAVAIGAPIVGAVVGLVGGAIAGSELVGYIYNKFARKFDSSLPQLDKTDKILGGVFAMAAWTPPMIAGVRNIFDGYNNMRTIQ